MFACPIGRCSLVFPIVTVIYCKKCRVRMITNAWRHATWKWALWLDRVIDLATKFLWYTIICYKISSHMPYTPFTLCNVRVIGTNVHIIYESWAQPGKGFEGVVWRELYWFGAFYTSLGFYKRSGFMWGEGLNEETLPNALMVCTQTVTHKDTHIRLRINGHIYERGSNLQSSH